MIRKNTINCKLSQLKILKKSAVEIYTEAVGQFRIEEEVCPTCGCKGGCSPHASYGRNLIDFSDGAPQYNQITVQRVICTCGVTHAILPDPVIPYDQYSLFFILLVLGVYFCHLMTVERICGLFAITPSMIYRWAAAYSKQRREWQGLLKSTTADIRRSMLEVVRKDPYSSFAIRFLQTTARSFLQTHANPANCRRSLQYAFPSGGLPHDTDIPSVMRAVYDGGTNQKGDA